MTASSARTIHQGYHASVAESGNTSPGRALKRGIGASGTRRGPPIVFAGGRATEPLDLPAKCAKTFGTILRRRANGVAAAGSSMKKE